MSKAEAKPYVEWNSYNNFLDYYVVHLLVYLISLRERERVSKLVFYAQSTGAVISGRYTSHIVYLIFNNVYVLKWVYIQF